MHPDGRKPSLAEGFFIGIKKVVDTLLEFESEKAIPQNDVVFF